MTEIRVAVWNVDEDVLDPYHDGYRRAHRTIIAAAGDAPPRGSIVMCGDFFFAPAPTIVAVGRVQRIQPASTARVRVLVDPFFLLDGPIGLELLQRSLDYKLSEELDEAIHRNYLYPRVFPPRMSETIVSAIRRSSSEASDFIDDLLSGTVRVVFDDLRPKEARDATTMASRFANISDSPSVRLLQGSLSQAEAAFGVSFDPRHVEDNEDDLIAADLRRFDDHAVLTDLTGSMVEIIDDKKRLIVMNINRKRLEQVSGVDLIYYDQTNDKAVTIQYKRMERIRTRKARNSSGTEWAYYRASELRDQLDLMRRQQFSSCEAPTTDDWRLSSSPNFFKFTWPQRFTPGDQRLIRGMYVPDEYLRLGIGEGRFNTGSNDGFEITSNNTKYFTSETFVELVRRCWIGTRKTDRSGLVDYARGMAAEHEVVVALSSASAR